MKNIVLIGMMGCGKSTFGKKLAERLSRPFVDCDDFIEAEEGKSIPALFTVSEDCFRDAETRAVKKLAEKEGQVIAAGGGIIKREENISALRGNSVILFLDRAPEDIATDVDVSHRPLLAEGPQKLFALYDERIALYRAAADLTVPNSGSEEEVLEQIVQALES